MIVAFQLPPDRGRYLYVVWVTLHALDFFDTSANRISWIYRAFSSDTHYFRS